MRINIINKIIRRLLPIALCGATLFVAIPSVHAALLSVEPTVTRMTVLPGWEWLGSISVSNPNSVAVQVEVGAINLVSGVDAQGLPVPVINESADAKSVSLAGWLTLPVKKVRIEPEATVKIPVALIVPPYAGHGEHRAAITFRQEGVRPSDGGVQVASTITSGFLVDVIGTEESRHDLRIADFSASSFMVSQFPVSVGLRMENHGTTLAVLDGFVEVEPLLGFGGVSFEVATPQEGRYLLPGKSYENTFELSDKAVGSRAGVYRARVHVMNGGNVLEESAYFVVVPLPLAAGLFVVLVISIVLIRLSVRSALRRRKQ